MTEPPPSKSQVNKAGRILRKWASGAEMMREDEVAAARKILIAHRASHQASLDSAVEGLRSAVKAADCSQMKVSQRLKRAPTIIDKLTRQPTMTLGNMQDIAGCRAVVLNLGELERVAKRLCEGADRVDDYVASPRKSGYRGIHMIRVYRGNPIEIQLRTEVMHQWALLVEDLGGQHAWDLKSGKGPHEVLAWLAITSQTMALDEHGAAIPNDLERQYLERRAAALALLHKGER